MLVNADIRNFEVDFIDEADPRFNSIGVKGVGEVAAVGAAGAIANAVYHATENGSATFRSGSKNCLHDFLELSRQLGAGGYLPVDQ
jgi:hypothetical protein